MTTTRSTPPDSPRAPADPRPATPSAEPAPLPRTGPRWGSVLSRYSLVLLWALMVAVFALVLPEGVSVSNAMKAIFGSLTPLVFLGMAVVSTMSVGEFDLSFASFYGLAGASVSALVVLHGWSFPAAALAAVALTLTFGLVNALLTVVVGISSVVVTLGTASVAGGLAFFISGQTTVSGMDIMLSRVALDRILGLPLIFWYGVILVAVFAYVMSSTPLGRHILFVGSNRDVARLAGIPVTQVRIGAYLTSAAITGLAGVVVAAGLGGFNSTTAETNLMPVFASVFLGTVAVVPGRFNPVGMLVAVYFLLTGVYGLQLLNGAGWITNVFYGVALVAAVTVSTIVQRRVRAG
jgi:ribose transport system permease protein